MFQYANLTKVNFLNYQLSNAMNTCKIIELFLFSIFVSIILLLYMKYADLQG